MSRKICPGPRQKLHGYNSFTLKKNVYDNILEPNIEYWYTKKYSFCNKRFTLVHQWYTTSIWEGLLRYPLVMSYIKHITIYKGMFWNVKEYTNIANERCLLCDYDALYITACMIMCHCRLLSIHFIL